MTAKSELELFEPKPYEVTRLVFDIFGKIPKSWLKDGKYGFNVNCLDLNGKTLQISGPSLEIKAGFLSKFRKKIRFHSRVDLNSFPPSEHPRGLIIEMEGQDNQFFLLPLIVGGTSKVYESEHVALREKLSQMTKKFIKLKIDWYNYGKELGMIRQRTVSDRDLFEGIFEILDKSEDTFEPIFDSKEEQEERALNEKYKDAIQWRGPFLGGRAGAMNGYNFQVHSTDHKPQHFHVIHKGNGIEASFVFPTIELLKYEEHSNIISSKDIKKIKEYFIVPEHLKKLSDEFEKQILLTNTKRYD